MIRAYLHCVGESLRDFLVKFSHLQWIFFGQQHSVSTSKTVKDKRFDRLSSLLFDEKKNVVYFSLLDLDSFSSSFFNTQQDVFAI